MTGPGFAATGLDVSEKKYVGPVTVSQKIIRKFTDLPLPIQSEPNGGEKPQQCCWKSEFKDPKIILAILVILFGPSGHGIVLWLLSQCSIVLHFIYLTQYLLSSYEKKKKKQVCLSCRTVPGLFEWNFSYTLGYIMINDINSYFTFTSCSISHENVLLLSQGPTEHVRAVDGFGTSAQASGIRVRYCPVFPSLLHTTSNLWVPSPQVAEHWTCNRYFQ